MFLCPYVLLFSALAAAEPPPLRCQPVSLLAHQQAGKANFYVLQHTFAKYPPQNLAYTQVNPTFAPLDIKFPARLRTGKSALLPASGHNRSCPPPESAKLRDFFARRNALAFSALRPFQEKFPKISPKFLRQKFGVCAKSPYLCTRKSEMRPTTPHKSEAIRSLKTLHKTIL